MQFEAVERPSPRGQGGLSFSSPPPGAFICNPTLSPPLPSPPLLKASFPPAAAKPIAGSSFLAHILSSGLSVL